MAKLELKLADDVLVKLTRLESGLDDITGRALVEGAKVAKSALREETMRVLNTDEPHLRRQTGQLLNAIGITQPGVSKSGDTITVKVGFSEPRRGDGKATSNAEVANVIEHGKSGQKARPFMKRALNKSKNEAQEKIIETFNSEVEKL